MCFYMKKDSRHSNNIVSCMQNLNIHCNVTLIFFATCPFSLPTVFLIKCFKNFRNDRLSFALVAKS